MAVIVPSQPRIKGGAVLTAVGDAPDQALYWELVGLDPETQAEGPALGPCNGASPGPTQALGRSISINPLPIRPLSAGWNGSRCGERRDNAGTSVHDHQSLEQLP